MLHKKKQMGVTSTHKIKERGTFNKVKEGKPCSRQAGCDARGGMDDIRFEPIKRSLLGQGLRGGVVPVPEPPVISETRVADNRPDETLMGHGKLRQRGGEEKGEKGRRTREGGKVHFKNLSNTRRKYKYEKTCAGTEAREASSKQYFKPDYKRSRGKKDKRKLREGGFPSVQT